MRTVYRTTFWSLAVLLLTAHPGHAQAGSLVERIQPGAEVRLETAEGRRVEGVVTEIDSSSIAVMGRDGDGYRLAHHEVQRAWRRTSSTGLYAGRGAIAGAVALGGYLSLLAGGLCEDDSCTGDFLEGLAVGAPLGALGGAAAGAILGALVRRWDPIDESEAAPASSGTGLSFHLGATTRPPLNGPEPVALIRAAVDRGIGSRRRGFVELSHVAYAEERFGPAGGEAARDAKTWSLALGLRQSLRSDPEIRVSASAGLARSSAATRFIGSPPAGGLDLDPVQWGSRLGIGIESGWSFGFAPGISVGLEARCDYLPLFLDGVGFFTLSAAVWG